jgi:hypothetical protein
MTTEAQVPVLDIEPSSAPKAPKTTKVARKRAPKRSAKAVAAPEQVSTLEVVVLEDAPASTTVPPQEKKRSRFARLMDYCFLRRGAKKRGAQRNASPVVEAVPS